MSFFKEKQCNIDVEIDVFMGSLFNPELIVSNLLNPGILFFLLGFIATFIKSDLEIPQVISKFVSYYLLFCIGLKGGEEIAQNGFDSELFSVLGLAVLLASIVPVYAFFILKRKFNLFDSAAIAATYGSISAVTFITAIGFLQYLEVTFSGYMIAAMALMEAPAIIVGLLLLSLLHKTGSSGQRGGTLKQALKESFTNGSVVLISGALVIGAVADEKSMQSLHPFTEDIFKGMLAFFLLDMGLLASKRLGSLKRAGWFPIVFALVFPLFNAGVALFFAWLFKLDPGNAFLLTVLSASASYIAVPAAMRISVPKANPGLYVPMSLAITFPFNIIIGLPLYYLLIEHFIAH